MEAYDKPFLTYDEQIDCLIEKHGLDVSDLRSLFTPKDNSRNEVMKKALFDSYAHAANLPMSLPNRLEVFHDCLRDK